MNWNDFDADRPNPEQQKLISGLITKIIKENNPTDIKLFAESVIKDFNNSNNDELNKTIGIQVFRPHEFNDITENDECLEYFLEWLKNQNIDWREGSEILKKAIRERFLNVNKTRIELGETYLSLDSLIEIKGKKIAIEVETSGNIDNGFFTIKQAIKKKRADFGLMITPWTNKPNLADEKKARERLDHEFDGRQDSKDGPIYSVTILRLYDVYQEMTKN